LKKVLQGFSQRNMLGKPGKIFDSNCHARNCSAQVRAVLTGSKQSIWWHISV